MDKAAALGYLHGMITNARRLALALSAAMLACSCVGIEADIQFTAAGSVELAITYRVSLAVDQLGKLGANADYLPLPVGRDDLALAATRAGGRLDSWSRRDGEADFTVSATLTFPDGASLAAFLDPEGRLASFQASGTTRTFTLSLSDGMPPADPEFTEFIKSAFGDYVVTVSVELPRAPSAQSGYAVSGRTATFSMPAAVLYARTEPTVLSLTW